MPDHITSKVYRLDGGLNKTADIFASKTNQWLSAQNMLIMNPHGEDSLYSRKAGAPTTPPPTYRLVGFTPTYTYNSYWSLPTIIQLATFEVSDHPEETWTKASGDGTLSTVAAITEGDEALQFAMTSGQSLVATGSVSSSNLSSAPTSIALDASVTNAGTLSGFLRIGSDSSNYREYDIGNYATGTHTMTFTLASPDNTVGTPAMTAIDWVQLELTATGGEATVVFDNLRCVTYTDTGKVDPGEINSAFYYEYTYGSVAAVYFASDAMYIQEYYERQSQWICKAGIGSNQIDAISYPDVDTPANQKLYFADGVNGVYSYDQNKDLGSRVTCVSETPWKHIASSKSIIWLANAETKPMTIAPSNTFTSTPGPTWTAANEITLDTLYAGEQITGMYPMSDFLAVATNKRIVKLYGSNPDGTTGDLTVIDTASGVGVQSQGAGFVVGTKLYFYSGNGLYVFDGNDSTRISTPVDDEINSNAEYTARIGYYEARGLLFLCLAGSDTTLTYHIPSGRWGTLSPSTDGVMDMNGCASSSQYFLGFGKRAFWFDPPVVSSDETYTSTLRTHWNPVSDTTLEKDFSELLIFLRDYDSGSEPASGTLTVYFDYSDSYASSQYTVTPVRGFISQVLNPGSRGKAISWQYSKALTNQEDDAFQISGYAVRYLPFGGS